MKIIIHPPNPIKKISWASGTSTELFICPPDGDFQTRAFDFRISTATVEAEETNFSDFSGLTRILLILKGKLTLIHEGRYSKELDTFDQDRFDGSWNTRSKGKVQDFNVMFNENYDASVLHLALQANKSLEIALDESKTFLFVFSGKYEINDQLVSAGDLVEIQTSKPEKVFICCLESGNIIESSIELKK
jgi:environmental stress-induced protein Ves